MLKTIATLKTPKTHLMVSDGQWTGPTEVISKLDAPTMSLLMYGPGYSAEGAFLDGTARKLCKVGRVIFTPHDRDVLGRGTPGKMRVVSCSFNRAIVSRSSVRWTRFRRSSCELSRRSKSTATRAIHTAHD